MHGEDWFCHLRVPESDDIKILATTALRSLGIGGSFDVSPWRGRRLVRPPL